MIGVRWGSATHQGRVRAHNEDALLAGPSIFAVADGMGGHAAGEVASAIAVAELANLADLERVPDPETHLRDALAGINAEIRRRSVLEPSAAGMGTTLAGVARAQAGDVIVFNVGDSRVYRLRKGALTQLTEDHSLVADLLRAGEISTEEAKTHPHRNVITRALGLEPDVHVDLRTERLAIGDCYLVASDGLFNELADGQILALLGGIGSVEARARALLDAALSSGGRDNISVVVVQVDGTDSDGDLDVDTSPSVPEEDSSSSSGDAQSAVEVRPLITAVPPSTMRPTATIRSVPIGHP